MSATLLFCTSKQITPQDLVDLNDCYRQSQVADIGQTFWYNALNHAHHDPTKMMEPSQESRDPIRSWNIEVFDEIDESQLPVTFQDIMHVAKRDGVDHIELRAFATLDETGRHNRTVVLRKQLIEDDDEEGAEDEGSETKALRHQTASNIELLANNDLLYCWSGRFHRDMAYKLAQTRLHVFGVLEGFLIAHIALDNAQSLPYKQYTFISYVPNPAS